MANIIEPILYGMLIGFGAGIISMILFKIIDKKQSNIQSIYEDLLQITKIVDDLTQKVVKNKQLIQDLEKYLDIEHYHTIEQGYRKAYHDTTAQTYSEEDKLINK